MITKEIMTYIKQQLKAQGITQELIASDFDVSLATVKRWYSGNGISLEKINEICDYLGISLSDVISSVKNEDLYFDYENEQEVFFSKNPEYLAFFDLLIKGRTLKNIEKKYNLSPKTSTRYLLKLDKLKLIELRENNKFKILVKGEPRWKRDGPLSKRFKDSILTSFFDSKNSLIENFNITEINDTDIIEIQKLIKELMIKVNQASNRAKRTNSKLKSYGLRVSLKEFTWDLSSYLKK